MKNYLATFANRNGTEVTLATDGISETHATARAWIDFMKTQSFREDEDGWELDELWDDSKRTGQNPWRA